MRALPKVKPDADGRRRAETSLIASLTACVEGSRAAAQQLGLALAPAPADDRLRDLHDCVRTFARLERAAGVPPELVLGRLKSVVSTIANRTNDNPGITAAAIGGFFMSYYGDD